MSRSTPLNVKLYVWGTVLVSAWIGLGFLLNPVVRDFDVGGIVTLIFAGKMMLAVVLALLVWFRFRVGWLSAVIFEGYSLWLAASVIQSAGAWPGNLSDKVGTIWHGIGLLLLIMPATLEFVWNRG